MQPNLDGMTVAVIGGDARYLDMIDNLVQSGLRVKVIGLPIKNMSDNVFPSSDLMQCLTGVKAVILPILGIDENGSLSCILSGQTFTLTKEIMSTLPKQALVFTGLAGSLLKQLTTDLDLRLIELMRLNEVAILNSIPSAEGVLQMAMEMLPITIHDSSAFVLGFGRTGQTLARLLQAMGAHTKVVARKAADHARIYEMNLQPLSFPELQSRLGEADIIFNTVPAPVLIKGCLESIKPGTLIIDLATAPGGTDFCLAESLGIKAVLAPSLPGKVAPKTAGRILAQAMKRFLF